MRGVDNDMSYKQTISRRALQTAALLSLLTTVAVWGQSKTDDLAFKTTTGCVGYRNSGSVPEVRNLRWSGTCQNGKLSGSGLLRGEFMPHNRTGWRESVALEYRASGLVSGIRLFISHRDSEIIEGLGIALYPIPGTDDFSSASFVRDTTKYPNNKSSSLAMAELDKFRSQFSGNESPDFQILVDIVNRWASGTVMMREQFYSMAIKPSAARPAPNGQPAASGDDPKVFGRSARGG